MDRYKILIRKRIKEKFKTIENFSKHIEIPRTTINFILKNGVGSSNFDMVNKILHALDIHTPNQIPIVLDASTLHFIELYNVLDEIGRHTVLSVAETECRRLYTHSDHTTSLAAYGGISSSKPLTDEEKDILDLVQKIKGNNINDSDF